MHDRVFLTGVLEVPIVVMDSLGEGDNRFLNHAKTWGALDIPGLDFPQTVVQLPEETGEGTYFLGDTLLLGVVFIGAVNYTVDI